MNIKIIRFFTTALLYFLCISTHCSAEDPYAHLKNGDENVYIIHCIDSDLFSEFGTIRQGEHIIHCRICGFFSNFLGVINNLAWCERNGRTPYVWWHSNFPYWQGEQYGTQNAWEYYFEQPIPNKKPRPKPKPKPKPHNVYFAPDGSMLIPPLQTTPYQTYRHEAARLVEKYIHLKPHVLEKVSTFFNDNINIKFTIGIHLRGTDKGIEKKLIPPQSLFNLANEKAAELKKQGIEVQFFIATDEEKYLTLAKSSLAGNVIFYDAIRSLNGIAIHHNGGNHSVKARMGMDILVEVLLLSQCDLFLHGHSNVSEGVLIFNPDLDHIDCQYMAQ